MAKLFNSFVRARDWYFGLPRFNFEAMTLGLALLFGLIVMPALIYVAGLVALRAYAHGGLFALYADFFNGLFEPRPSFWAVVAGPVVFVTVLRMFHWVLSTRWASRKP